MANNVSKEKIEQALALFIKEDRKINGNTIAKYLNCTRSNLVNNYGEQLAIIDIVKEEQKKRWESKRLSNDNKKLREKSKKQKKIISELNSSEDEMSILISHINSVYKMYDDTRVRYENVSVLLAEYKEKYGPLD